MLTVCPLIDGSYPITSKEDAAATNPDVVVVDLRTGATLATLTVAGGAVTSSGNFWICDLNHATASAVQAYLQRTQNAHARLAWGMAAAGGGSDQIEEITSNTAEHDAALYPDGFIFVEAGGATVTAFAYGNGSIIEPAGELEYGAVCSVARGSPKKFDVAGTFGGSSGNGVSGAAVGAGAGIGTEYNGAYVRCRTTCSIYPEIYADLDVQNAYFDGAITWNSFRYLTTLNCNGTYFRGGAIKSSTKWVIRGGTWDSCTIEDEFEFNFWNFDMIGCTFKGALVDFAAFAGGHSSSPFPIVSCIGDFTLANVSTSVTFQIIGHKAGTITTSGTQPSSISLSGSYQLTNSAGWTIASNLPAALQADFGANITNLAAGSITPTEAPNLDVAVSSVAGGGAADWSATEKNQIRQRLSLDGTQANPTTAAGDFETLLTNVDATVSSRSAFNAAGDTVTVGTNNDKAGYSISGTIQTLEALDTAQDVQHAATQADIAALTIPTAGQNADAVWDEAYSGHTTAGSFGKLLDTLRKSNLSIEGQVSGTPTATAFDSNLTEVTGAHDHQVALFVSGALLGESRPIDTYSATNGRIVLQEALTAAPAASDEFVVLAQHVHPIADIQSGLATSSALASVAAGVSSALANTQQIRGLVLGDSLLDCLVYDANGFLERSRLRLFASASAANGATQVRANAAGTVVIVSSSGADTTQTATVRGLVSGVSTTDAITLTGTSPAAGVVVFDAGTVFGVTLSGTTAGTVALSDSGAATLFSVSAGSTQAGENEAELFTQTGISAVDATHPTLARFMRTTIT